MKNVIVALILGLSLSVNAQNDPKGNLETKSVETTDNQTTKTSNKVSNNTTPVVINSTRSVEETQKRRAAPIKGDGDNSTSVVQYRTEPKSRRTYQKQVKVRPCYTLFEINTRPMSDMSGYLNLGLELSTGCKSSLLFDVSSGTNQLLGLQVSSAMIGFRSYNKKNMTGSYISARARGRSYENGSSYGGNISLMYGWKQLLPVGISMAIEGGLGYQGIGGVYSPLPTWAITVGYRL
jgi:hypothetical protein